jgi:hypothetical protein
MQLSLQSQFDNQAKDNILSQKALELLNALNDGEKKRYEPFAYLQLDKLILLIAKREKDYLFNLIDLDGNTPLNMSSCWRVGSVIYRDLDEISLT